MGPYACDDGQPLLGVCFCSGIVSFSNQEVGLVAVDAFVFILNCIIRVIINSIMGIPVSREKKLQGLDISEHAMEGYPDFESLELK